MGSDPEVETVPKAFGETSPVSQVPKAPRETRPVSQVPKAFGEASPVSQVPKAIANAQPVSQVPKAYGEAPPAKGIPIRVRTSHVATMFANEIHPDTGEPIVVAYPVMGFVLPRRAGPYDSDNQRGSFPKPKPTSEARNSR